jgi:hypothetical protein
MADEYIEEEIAYLREPDPEPLSIFLEIVNLIIQPGTLAAIIGGGAAAAQAVITYQDVTARKRSDIRRALFEIERALNKGFAGLVNLTSLLYEFGYTRNPKRIGGAPIQGFKNSEALRRTHEDCRAAVKEARDAFINLSSLLPNEHIPRISGTLERLNSIAEPILSPNAPYGLSIVVLADALTEVDALISNIGENYDFDHQPRDYRTELTRAFVRLREYQ